MNRCHIDRRSILSSMKMAQKFKNARRDLRVELEAHIFHQPASCEEQTSSSTIFGICHTCRTLHFVYLALKLITYLAVSSSERVSCLLFFEYPLLQLDHRFSTSCKKFSDRDHLGQLLFFQLASSSPF